MHDASANSTALLPDAGPHGQWVWKALSVPSSRAPSLLAFECSNIIRRHELAGLVQRRPGCASTRDLLALPVEHWPYELLGLRVWELRTNMSTYGASYVAVAELTQAPLVTLDRCSGRARSSGVRS